MGEDVRGKARFVSRYTMHREAVFFFSTFSATPGPSSIEMIAVTAFQQDRKFFQWEIEQAIVHSNIDRDSYRRDTKKQSSG